MISKGGWIVWALIAAGFLFMATGIYFMRIGSMEGWPPSEVDPVAYYGSALCLGASAGSFISALFASRMY